MTPYEAGKLAFYGNEPCPYEVGTQECREWLDGVQDARSNHWRDIGMQSTYDAQDRAQREEREEG